MEQRVAIVTGGLRGLGRAMAFGLATAGHKVMAVGHIDTDVIGAERATVGSDFSGKVVPLVADLRQPADCDGVVAAAQREFGAVDILVNNAGIQHVAKIVDFPEERWDAVIAINLSAAFHATKAALPLMIARRWGRVINIASAHGLVASGEKAAYVAAKHGLVGLTKVAAIETANQGVTCNAICPGWVLTPLVEQQIAARAREQGIPVEQAREDLVREKQPMLDYTTPEKLGALAVFLCGEAASTITGAALSIDGGWVAQ
jgi:3-hydroxybutyrate dehydrogenase